MPVNFNNIDSYEALEEILKWKRNKPKRKPKRNKVKDKIDIELSIRNLFCKLNKT